MKKQTAVEWLIEQISEKQPNGLYVIDSLDDVKNVFEQAKAMEKEQIGKSYQQGLIDGMNHTPKNYYNETYNTDTP